MGVGGLWGAGTGWGGWRRRCRSPPRSAPVRRQRWPHRPLNPSRREVRRARSRRSTRVTSSARSGQVEPEAIVVHRALPSRTYSSASSGATLRSLASAFGGLALDGADGDAEQVGGLGLGAVLEEPQHQHGPLLGGELRQRGPQGQPERGLLGVVRGRSPPRGSGRSPGIDSATRRRRHQETCRWYMVLRVYASALPLSCSRLHERWVRASADWTRSSARCWSPVSR